jgi:DNA mismatch repair ATPase MutL
MEFSRNFQRSVTNRKTVPKTKVKKIADCRKSVVVLMVLLLCSSLSSCNKTGKISENQRTSSSYSSIQEAETDSSSSTPSIEQEEGEKQNNRSPDTSSQIEETEKEEDTETPSVSLKDIDIEDIDEEDKEQKDNQTDIPTAYVVMQVNHDVNVRTAASSDSSIHCTVRKGTTVYAVTWNEYWTGVVMDGAIYYIYSPCLDIVSGSFDANGNVAS